MRRSVLVAAAVALASIPATADAKKPETCFGRKPDIISTKNGDTVRLGRGGDGTPDGGGPPREVAIIKGNRTRAIVNSFDSDPGAQFTNRIAVCVKGDHVRLQGFINRVHSSGDDTRLVFRGPCGASVHGEPRWFRVYQVDVKPCDPDDDFIGP